MSKFEHHSFRVEVAMEYDVPMALFLQHVAHWITHNKRNNKHFYEGLFWTYNTVDAIQEYFPYWTEKQIRTVRDKCIDAGLLIKGNHNKTKYDQTLWYALTEKGCDLFGISNLPKGKTQLTKRSNGNDQKGKPIPSIEPSTKPSTQKHIVDSGEPTTYKDDKEFMSVYDIYPNKQSPQAAYKAWKKLKPNPELVSKIRKDIGLRTANNWNGRPKNMIPHPATYLNRREWEGEIVLNQEPGDKEKPKPYTMEELFSGVL